MIDLLRLSNPGQRWAPVLLWLVLSLSKGWPASFSIRQQCRPHLLRADRLKRRLDIVSASPGLFFLGLAFPFIAAIYLDCPGPILYSQWRAGKGGRRFRAYKFRSLPSTN